jgi:MFS family permease
MLRRVYIATASGFASFYLMLPLVPLLAAKRGSDFDAGLVTFVFMAATVAAQLLCPWLLRWTSNRLLLAYGTLLVGVPSLAYSASRAIVWVSTVSVVRGAGFGLMTVASSTLVTGMASSAHRGRSIGMYGLLASGMGVFCPALGLWMARALGPTSAFLLAALAGVLACTVLVGRWDEMSTTRPRERAALRPLLRVEADPGSLAFLGGVMLAAIYSFLALRVSHDAGLAILAFGCSFAAARLQLGRLADSTWEVEALLITSIIAGTAGMAGLALSSELLIACLCAIAAGAGAGGILSLSLLIMVRRSHGELAMATTLWNVAYDSGNALGGIGLGAVIGPLGLVGPYAVTSILLCAAAAAVAGKKRLLLAR